MYHMTASLSVSQHQARLFYFSFSSPEISTLRKIISLLVEIKEEQQKQWVVLRNIQARLQGQTADDEEEVEALDMELPLMTLKELDEMETQLEDPAVQKRMVIKRCCSCA